VLDTAPEDSAILHGVCFQPCDLGIDYLAWRFQDSYPCLPMPRRVLRLWRLFHFPSGSQAKANGQGLHTDTSGNWSRVGPPETEGYIHLVINRLPPSVDSFGAFFYIWISIWIWFISTNSCPGELYSSYCCFQFPHFHFYISTFTFFCFKADLAETTVAKRWTLVDSLPIYTLKRSTLAFCACRSFFTKSCTRHSSYSPYDTLYTFTPYSCSF
jgi:hypothetical protein